MSGGDWAGEQADARPVLVESEVVECFGEVMDRYFFAADSGKLSLEDSLAPLDLNVFWAVDVEVLPKAGSIATFLTHFCFIVIIRRRV